MPTWRVGDQRRCLAWFKVETNPDVRNNLGRLHRAEDGSTVIALANKLTPDSEVVMNIQKHFKT